MLYRFAEMLLHSTELNIAMQSCQRAGKHTEIAGRNLIYREMSFETDMF